MNHLNKFLYIDHATGRVYGCILAKSRRSALYWARRLMGYQGAWSDVFEV